MERRRQLARFIRVADGVDPVELNRRINEMLQKNLPDTESLQLVIDAAPLTDTYMSNDEVRAHGPHNARAQPGPALHHDAELRAHHNSVTVKEGKVDRHPQMQRCGSPTIFSMFIIETLMVLGCALVLMVIPHTGVWRHDKGHYQHHAEADA